MWVSQPFVQVLASSNHNLSARRILEVEYRYVRITQYKAIMLLITPSEKGHFKVNGLQNRLAGPWIIDYSVLYIFLAAQSKLPVISGPSASPFYAGPVSRIGPGPLDVRDQAHRVWL